jgi:hypothetical protein
MDGRRENSASKRGATHRSSMELDDLFHSMTEARSLLW